MPDRRENRARPAHVRRHLAAQGIALASSMTRATPLGRKLRWHERKVAGRFSSSSFCIAKGPLFFGYGSLVQSTPDDSTSHVYTIVISTVEAVSVRATRFTSTSTTTSKRLRQHHHRDESTRTTRSSRHYCKPNGSYSSRRARRPTTSSTTRTCSPPWPPRKWGICAADSAAAGQGSSTPTTTRTRL